MQLLRPTAFYSSKSILHFKTILQLVAQPLLPRHAYQLVFCLCGKICFFVKRMFQNKSLTCLRRNSSELYSQQFSKPFIFKMKLSAIKMLFLATVTMATPTPIMLEGTLQTIPANGAGSDSPLQVRCFHYECPCTGWDPSSCQCQPKQCNGKTKN